MPNSDSSDQLTTIRQLIAINEQNVTNLESVASAIEDRGLGQVLEDFALDCEHFSHDLENWIDDHQPIPAEQADSAGAGFRLSLNGKTTRHEILATTERAEETVLDRYRTAIENTTQPDLKRLLIEQFEQLQDIHNWLHRVRLAVAA